jgi:hypothetical protein
LIEPSDAKQGETERETASIRSRRSANPFNGSDRRLPDSIAQASARSLSWLKSPDARKRAKAAMASRGRTTPRPKAGPTF